MVKNLRCIFLLATAARTALMLPAITMTVEYSIVDCPFWHKRSIFFRGNL